MLTLSLRIIKKLGTSSEVDFSQTFSLKKKSQLYYDTIILVTNI